MCGIIGYVAGKDPVLLGKRESFLHQGLFVDSLRGMGGAGVGLVSKKEGSISVYKRALAGPDYLNSMVWELAQRQIFDSRVVIGHNRAATIGSVKDKNCHPFHYKDKQEIVMVHNGTLHTYHSLSPTGFNHEVDSAHIAAALAHTENEMDALKKLKGAFVLIWYNRTKNTFNVARNSFREISFMMSKNGDLFFASEWGMLDWLLTRNEIDTKWKEYRWPESDTWWEYGFQEDGSLKKAVVRKIKYEEEPRYRGGYKMWDDADEAGERDLRRAISTPIAPHVSVLSKIGFEYNEKIIVELVKFHPYPNNPRGYGRATGSTCLGLPDTEHDVEVHSIREEEYNAWDKEWGLYLPARVNSAKMIAATEKGAKPYYELSCSIDREELHRWEDKGPSTELNDFVTGPNGILIKFKDWQEKTKQGCANCSSPIQPSGFNQLHWITGAEPAAVLCHACSSDLQVVNQVDPAKAVVAKAVH